MGFNSGFKGLRSLINIHSEVKVKVQFSYMQATEAYGEWSISPPVLNFDGNRWR